MATFEELVTELSEALGTELKPDEENAILLEFPEGDQIAIELGDKEQSIVLGCDVATLPPGRGREATFRAALQFNGLSTRVGDLAYSRRTDKLVLMGTLPLRAVSGPLLLETAQDFIAISRTWRENILRGEIPHVPLEEQAP